MLKFGNTYLNYGGTYLSGWTVYDPNPLNLPPYTIRVKYREGVTPTFSKGTAVQVPSLTNVWDLTYVNSNWSSLFSGQSDLLEVLGANTTDVTNMSKLFYDCTSVTVQLFDTSNVTDMSLMFRSGYSLKTVPLFDTSKVTNMNGMFDYCIALTLIPLFNTSNVTDMSWMFNNCTKVQSGALALYRQARYQSNPPSNHSHTFYKCGVDTQTGNAELAQIASSWIY